MFRATLLIAAIFSAYALPAVSGVSVPAIAPAFFCDYRAS